MNLPAKILLSALTLVAPAVASDSNTQDEATRVASKREEIELAMSHYAGCVKDNVDRYLPGAFLPSDIAAAAIAKCVTERGSYEKAFTGWMFEMGSRVEAATSASRLAGEKRTAELHGLAIARVLDARLPKSKRP